MALIIFSFLVRKIQPAEIPHSSNPTSRAFWLLFVEQQRKKKRVIIVEFKYLAEMRVGVCVPSSRNREWLFCADYYYSSDGWLLFLRRHHRRRRRFFFHRNSSLYYSRAEAIVKPLFCLCRRGKTMMGYWFHFALDGVWNYLKVCLWWENMYFAW